MGGVIFRISSAGEGTNRCGGWRRSAILDRRPWGQGGIEEPDSGFVICGGRGGRSPGLS